MAAQVEHYGTTGDGRAVQRITLRCGDYRAVFIDYGARLVEFWMPDRDGRLDDIVLGHPNLADHEAGTAYFGAICGRYGNRIRGGRLILDGAEVQLSRNEGANHLHGGVVGFDRHVWNTEWPDESSVRFSLEVPDGDQGFPGRLTATVDVRLGDGTLDITMSAVTDRVTVVNMVQHSYWNLAGAGSGDILDQVMWIDADFYTPVDDQLLPTGEILRIAGTPFDFRKPTPIGRHIHDVGSEGADGGSGRDAPGGFAGFDHNWVLRGSPGDLRHVVTVSDPGTGRRMELSTNEAGVQLYTAGYLTTDVAGKDGGHYAPFQGFTLETQRFPDSPNVGHFPSARLDPGDRYEHVMQFRFSTD